MPSGAATGPSGRRWPGRYAIITRDGHLVGFYDFEVESAGSELPLFYIDLEALRGLAEEVEGFSDAVEEAKGILERGYIGGAFPLYYPPTTINPESMPGRP